jgi:hypothetical protein
MPNMRNDRAAPDRPAIAHDPQNRWGHDVVEDDQLAAHAPAALQLPLRERNAVPQRDVDLGTRHAWQRGLRSLDHIAQVLAGLAFPCA